MNAVITPSMAQLADAMKRHAETGFYDGTVRSVSTRYFALARQIHQESGTMLLFTRDVGHHTCGWFKNQDYERCYHLSLSFWDLENDVPKPYEERLAETWVHAIYGQRTRYVWEENASLNPEMLNRVLQGHRPPNQVRHYRVFCDPAWQPIIPRGEVYTRDFIEKGWLSWSDRQYELRKAERGNS